MYAVIHACIIESAAIIYYAYIYSKVKNMQQKINYITFMLDQAPAEL